MNKATYVDQYGNNGISNLVDVQFDSAETVVSVVFQGKFLSLPNCVYMYNLHSKTLEYLYLPKCETMVYGIKAPELKCAYLPELKTIGNDKTEAELFYNCYALEEINLPKLENINGYIIYNETNEDRSKTKIKRVYAPLLDNPWKYNTRSHVFYSLETDLPTESSDAVLAIDANGYNLTYSWYYSQTGDEDTFEEIPNATKLWYEPKAEGYYYAVVKSNIAIYDKTGGDPITSTVCHYTNYEGTTSYPIYVEGTEKFTVFANDKTYTATEKNGKYIVNVDALQGSKVTVQCNNSNFESWLDANNRVKSTKNSYTFTVISDLSLICKTRDEGTVEFYNGNGDLISSQTYSSFSDDDFPDEPGMYGFNFKGWSMTASEIDNAIKNGEIVTVEALFEKTMTYYSLTLYGGTVCETDGDKESEGNSYREFSLVTLSPSEEYIDSFVCWKDKDSNIISYKADYSFYVSCDMEIFAVYGDDEIQKEAITRITNVIIDREASKIIFVAEREVPEDCTVLSHGIILTENAELDEDTFVIGSEDVLQGISVKNSNSGTYTLYKSNLEWYDTWYARSYVIYQMPNGTINTKYSSISRGRMY
jgi:hypothetical protein